MLTGNSASKLLFTCLLLLFFFANISIHWVWFYEIYLKALILLSDKKLAVG